MAKQCCESCQYYLGTTHSKDPAATGICRRYPPSAVAYGNDDDHIETVVWPLVNEAEWCGEYLPA